MDVIGVGIYSLFNTERKPNSREEHTERSFSMNIKGSTAMHRRSCLREVSRSAAARFIRVGRYRARRAAGRVVLSSLVCAAGVMCATSARAEPNDDDRPKVTRTVTDEQNAPFSDIDPCIGGVSCLERGTNTPCSLTARSRRMLIPRSGFSRTAKLRTPPCQRSGGVSVRVFGRHGP